MAYQAESSRRAPPTTAPPSLKLPEDSNSEAILWPASDDDSSSNPHDTDLLSLWLSNYTPFPEAEVEPVADVPTLLNFHLESSFLDLGDWKTTDTAVTQVPGAVTQPLWVRLDAPAAGVVDDLSQLTIGLQSPDASVWPQLVPEIHDPDETFVSPLALAIHTPLAADSEMMDPQASVSPLALGGIQLPPASDSGIQTPQFPIESPEALAGTDSSMILPLALGIQAPQTIPFATPSSLESSWPPIPQRTLPMAPPLWTDLSPVPCTMPIMAPPLWNLQPNPRILPIMAPPLWSMPPPPCTCTFPMPPPLWNYLPLIPSSLPMAPPLRTMPLVPGTLPLVPPMRKFLPSPPLVPERRSWSVLTSTPPPAPARQLLQPPAASASVSASASSLHFELFPAQQAPAIAHAPVKTTGTPTAANASFEFFAGSVPATPSRPEAVPVPRRSWTLDQPWINGGQDNKKRPIARRRGFLLPPPAATVTMPVASAAPLTNFESRSSVGIMARGDHVAAVKDHEQRDQRVQTPGETSRPRKRSKLALEPSGSKASHSSHDGTKVALIAKVPFAPPLPALNRDGKARALPGTATDLSSLFARYQRQKLKQRIKILQMLVPKGNKADMVILLEQAHKYIKLLEQHIKLLKSSVDWRLSAPLV